MNDLAMNVGANMVNNAFERTKAQMAGPKSKIDWNDFNWPPFLRVVHFSLAELKDPHLPLVKMLYLIFLLNSGHFALNFFVTIVQVIVGYSGIRILCSILVFILLTALSFFAFYNGYRGVCENKDLLFRFKIATGILFGIHFIMLIANTLNFNGIVRAVRTFKDGHGFAGFLCILEILYIVAMDGFSAFQIYRVLKWNHQPVNY